MQPSRGLRRIAQCRLPRHIHCQSRNLTSFPQHNLRHVSCASTLRLPQRPIAASIPAIIAIRNASTNSTPPPAQATATTPPPASDTPSFPNLDTITLDNIDLKNPALGDISAIPEGIGYLKQIGIDFGIGPTSAIEWFLEHVHIWGGLPWWASIVSTAFAIRLVMFPLFLRSSDMIARQSALVSVTKPINERMTKAQKEGNTQEMAMCWQQLSAIRKRAGISIPQQLMPLVIQGVIGYCGFKLMRTCAQLPVPGFVDGGFLWLTDLTLTDGYLLMPIIMAGTIHMVVRLGGETGAGSATMPPAIKKFMMWGMPAMIALITAWQPGAVCVWFASTGLMGIAQGQALQRPKMREFFGIAPLYQPKPGEGSGSFLDTMMKEKLDELKGNSSTSPQPSGRPASGAMTGKNAAFMRPTYQSPNLQRQTSSRTIDTTLTTPQPRKTAAAAPEMIQPNTKAAPQKGLFSGVTDKINEIKKAVKQKGRKTAAQQKEAEKAAFKKRAEKYEQNAQQRGR